MTATATARVRPFPLGALLGAGGLLAVAMLSAGTARMTGVGVSRMPEAQPVETRQLHFRDRADGAVVVQDARSGEDVAALSPGTNGFARSVLRGLVRERKRSDIAAAEPFRLTRWADGRLSLEDPATGHVVNLEAFGPSNAGVFAQFMQTRGDLR